MSLTEEIYALDPLDREPEYVEPVLSREERLKGARVLGLHERLPMVRIRDLEGDEYFIPLSALPEDGSAVRGRIDTGLEPRLTLPAVALRGEPEEGG